MNVRSIIDYPHAIAGDLVFTTNKWKSFPIVKYQRLRGFPHADKAHVACIVSPVDIMEAMLGKKSYTLTYEEWLKTRPSNDDFFVLRNPINSLDQTGNVIDAALFFLEEDYALGDAIRDTFRETPERVGHSICSVTASKVLKRAGLVDSEIIPTDRQIYPGPLYALLLEQGWVEIKPGSEYFIGELATSIPSQIQQRVLIARAAAKMRENLAVTDSLTGRLDEYLDVLPAEDTFFSMAASPHSFVLDLISNMITEIVQNHIRTLNQIDEGAGHWKNTENHKIRLNALTNATYEKQKLALKLLSELLSKVEIGFNLGLADANISDIRRNLSEDKLISYVKLQKLLHGYYQCELSFLAVVGRKASNFASKTIELDEAQIESLSVKDQEAVREVFKSFSSVYDNTRSALKVYATQIGNIRKVIEALVAEESMKSIDDLIENQMDSMLFEKIRRSELFKAAEEIRLLFR